MPMETKICIGAPTNAWIIIAVVVFLVLYTTKGIKSIKGKVMIIVKMPKDM